MSNRKGEIVVGPDMVIKGRIRNCTNLEIHGYVEGDLVCGSVVVHPEGKLYGKVKAEDADISGALQGDVSVRNLVSVRKSGSVNGNVRYGRIAVEDGGLLTADLRNVPPELFGDFEMTVPRGGRARVTTHEVTALDPDDAAEKLRFSVANAKHGFVARNNSPAQAVDNFTQADLEAGGVIFVHDGSEGKSASFDVVVKDAAGASSGAPLTVRVAVR